MSAQNKIKLNRILAFSLPSLPLAALGLPVVIQLPPFYAQHVGLSMAVVGAIFMGARLFDVFVDLGLGILMDKTKTRFGKFTPWLLAGSPIMALFCWFLFMAKPGAGPLYLMLSLLGTYIAFSMCMLAQLGVGASLSNDYHERSRIFGIWQIGNIIGMLLVLAIPVINSSLGGTYAQGVNYMGIFIIIMMPLSSFISWKFAKENPSEVSEKPHGISDFTGLVKLKSFANLLTADFVVSFSLGITGGLFEFYLSTVKGYKTESSLLLLLYFVSGLAFASLWTFISQKYGKHVAFMLASLYMIVTQGILFIMPENNIILASIFMIIAGVVYAAPILLLRAMVGDAADEDKLNSKKDKTGVAFAFMTLTSKLGYAISIGISYLILGLIGFDPKLGINNTSFAINGMQAIYFIIPIVCFAYIAFIMKKYPLDAAKVAEVQKKLAEIKSENQ